jgi:hypothetical protein
VRNDAITRDIRAAIRSGYFDGRRQEGPSELETTPTLELLERVELMSPAERRAYLARIGRFRHGPASLSGEAIGPSLGGQPPSLLGGTISRPGGSSRVSLLDDRAAS